MLMFLDRRKFLKMAHLVEVFMQSWKHDPDKSLKMPLNFKQSNIFQSTIIIIVYFLILMLLLFLKMILTPVPNFHGGEK